MGFLKNNCPAISITVFILAVLLTPIISTHNYNRTKNTMSDLAARCYSPSLN
jgi:hypothetical protein